MTAFCTIEIKDQCPISGQIRLKTSPNGNSKIIQMGRPICRENFCLQMSRDYLSNYSEDRKQFFNSLNENFQNIFKKVKQIGNTNHEHLHSDKFYYENTSIIRYF